MRARALVLQTSNLGEGAVGGGPPYLVPTNPLPWPRLVLRTGWYQPARRAVPTEFSQSNNGRAWRNNTLDAATDAAQRRKMEARRHKELEQQDAEIKKEEAELNAALDGENRRLLNEAKARTHAARGREPAAVETDHPPRSCIRNDGKRGAREQTLGHPGGHGQDGMASLEFAQL